MKPCKTKLMIVGIAGLFFTIVGFTLSLSWPLIFHKILSNELPITERSRVFNLWKNSSDIPLYMEFYFFNWTNPEELRVPGKKPNLIQVGPYVFEEKREKINVVFHSENNTVSYDQRKFWYFNKEKSNGSLSDELVQLNVVAVSAAHVTQYWTPIIQATLSVMLNKFSQIYIVKTVDELLFTGYEDKLIDMSKMIRSAEDFPPFDRFGWFYKRNGSTSFDGHYNMATGEDNLDNLGVLKNWNYHDTTSYYKSPCNIVEGSAGELWPPHRNKFEDITIWTADLCRPVTYEYTGTVIHKGILGYKYEIGEKTLGNSTKKRYPHDQTKYFERKTTTEDFFNAEHSTTESNEDYKDPDTIDMGQCYCNGECSPVGVVNITACRYGAPGFVSLPHFYKADPVFREQVIGMNPNEHNHSFYITLEPNTAVPLDVAARFQINILLQPSLSIDLFKNIPKIYFPIFWFNLRVEVKNDLAWDLHKLLMLPKNGFYGTAVLTILGVIILIIIVVRFIRAEPNKLMIGRRKVGIFNRKNTEAVYMDTTITNDEHDRRDCALQLKS